MALRLVPPLHRATHRVGLYLAGLEGDALSQGEAHILALLATKSPATVGELHQGLAHKRSTLTSILDRLVERGLVTRTVATTDRRTFAIAPTTRGRAVARRVLRHLQALERSVTRQVTEAEIAGYLNVVQALEAEAGRQVD